MKQSAQHPGALPALWRERAQFLEAYGDPLTARLWHLAARELEDALHAEGNATLSLSEAAEVTGFTADYLGALVRQGKLRNVGRKNAPRVRRGDLPSKRTGGPGRPTKGRLSVQQIPFHEEAEK